MSDERELMEAMRAAAEKRGGQIPEGGPGAAQTEALPIDWSTEPTPASANGAQVLHTAQQFAVLFTDMVGFPGRHAADGRAGNERARVVSSLRLDPATYFQVLSAMASNWNKYVETHVPPQMRQPRFKLLDAGEMQLYGIKTPKEED